MRLFYLESFTLQDRTGLTILIKTSGNSTFGPMFPEKYLIAENPPSQPGPGLVFCTIPPFYVGKVVQFKTQDEMASFMANSNNSLNFYQCSGYRIGILVIGKLSNELPPSGSLSQYSFPGMADYFLNNKILKSASYYKRYKEE